MGFYILYTVYYFPFFIFFKWILCYSSRFVFEGYIFYCIAVRFTNHSLYRHVLILFANSVRSSIYLLLSRFNISWNNMFGTGSIVLTYHRLTQVFLSTWTYFLSKKVKTSLFFSIRGIYLFDLFHPVRAPSGRVNTVSQTFHRSNTI